MELQDFIKQCETVALQAQVIRQEIQQETNEMSEVAQETIQFKEIIKECLDQNKTLKELQIVKENIDVDKIRAKQQTTKETHRHERLEEMIEHLFKANEQEISEKDEQIMYRNHFKNYLIRRITGMSLNLEEMSKGNVSGWISKLRLSTFETFEWGKDEKTDEEARDFLWDMSAKMDPESHENWNRPELFGED